jgi:hypothetical protein
MEATTRNATLGDLRDVLLSQQARKLDVVAPASKIRSEGGLLVVEGTEAILGPDGVTSADGVYRPTVVADEGIADKLGIPIKYLRRMRDERPDIFDANVNGWLHGIGDRMTADGRYTPTVHDPRSFLVRTFRPDDEGSEGVARAFLSPRYRIIENLDVLTAVLEGIKASGVPVKIVSADLTDRRMYVKVSAPLVSELAPELLAGYRSPYTGANGSDNPVVFAGFVFGNSEVGNGAWTITPQITVLICSNGLTLTKDAFRSIHLGGRQDDGLVTYAADTQEAELDVLRLKARDAVSTFLDIDFLRAKIGQLTEGASSRAGVDEVTTVTKKLAYGEDRSNAILDLFVEGGQLTRGGIAQAISAQAQRETDADVAYRMEEEAASVLLAA